MTLCGLIWYRHYVGYCMVHTSVSAAQVLCVCVCDYFLPNLSFIWCLPALQENVFGLKGPELHNREVGETATEAVQ